MARILSSRIFRCLICLLLISCFLVNSSPLRAKALEPVTTTVLGTVAVAVAVAAAFQVLGVMAGSDPVSFNDAVNNCVTYLMNSTSFVVNGMVTVCGLVGSDGIVRSYILKDLIETVLQWLFDSGTVVSHSSSLAVGDTITMINGKSYLLDSSCTRFQAWQPVGTSGGGYVYDCLISLNPIRFYLDGTRNSASVYAPDGVQYAFYNVSKWYSSMPSGYVSIGVEDVDFTENVTWRLIRCFAAGLFGISASGLVLGQIQGPNPGQDVTQLEELEVYTDYITKIEYYPNGVPDDDDDQGGNDGSPTIPAPLPWLPAGIPTEDYTDDTVDQPQDEAQEGITGIEFDFDTEIDPDPGTDTDPDPGTGTNPVPDPWTPPSDMGKFTLDLKQYFPFCIPFDLYAFFTCLNAEPVAPVIEWLIPLPGGKTYPFEIDLSTFDSVAQILRRMQLLLFCVGLAFKTRDLIKG